MPRFGIAAALAATVVLAGAPGAWAAPSSTSTGSTSTGSTSTGSTSTGSTSTGASSTTLSPSGATTSSAGSLADEAASLAEQIQAQGMQADRLSEQVDAAQIRVGQIADQLQGAQASLAITSTKLHRASTTLAGQALAAYMHGGRAPLTYVAHDTTDNKALIDGYASVVAGIQHRDVVAYDALRQQQAVQEQTLTDAESSATASVEQLQVAQHAARAAADAEQTTLDNLQTQGPLNNLVTQAETTQYQQTAGAVQSRFDVAPAPGQTPGVPLGPAVQMTSASPGAGAPVAARPVTTAPAAAAPGVGVTRAPPATSAPVVGTTPITAAPRPVITTAPAAPSSPPSGASAAIAYARAQLGKPYAWGGAGPGSFDCSGLVMQAWAAAGVYFPHLAQDQYDETARVAISALQTGDLVFFGTPDDVYHVGIYLGGGEMIDAPHTGADVRIEGIYWSDLLAGGRVR